METIYQQLADLARQYGAQRLVLFGSRARGDHHPRSDIDLAVYGLAPSVYAGFRLDLEDLPTLLQFDCVPIEPTTDPALLAEIERDGVTLYDAENHEAG